MAGLGVLKEVEHYTIGKALGVLYLTLPDRTGFWRQYGMRRHIELGIWEDRFV
jgi:hypothetical protein